MSEDPIRILVVDDETGIRKGCERILTAEGYGVETAQDGIEGLEIFLKHRNFAAAFVDLKMPKMDGIELVERIREHDEEIVIFMITAYATIETAVEVTKKGAYSYIPKPFTPDELLLNLEHGLERRNLLLEAKRLREEREARLLELASERSKSSTIIKCMTDGVLVINREGRLVLQNAAAGRMVSGYSSESLPSFMLNALECQDIEEVIHQIWSADDGPAIVSRELAVEQSTYMMNVSPVTDDPHREPAGIVVVLRDITALKKLEIAKSMFVSMVAHEIKSPLSAVEGYLNLILGGQVADKPEKQHSMLERSLLRINTLRNMVSELMNLTAMETGKFTIRRSQLDLGLVLSEAIDSCRERAEESHTVLSVTGEHLADLDHVLADRDAMFIVFRNLIDNAIKYTPENGHVTVQVEQNGIYIKVKVKDTGIGMTPEEKNRVFEEFFRAKNAFTANVPGTGLGLSLVKRLVDMHNGTINVESTVGEGTEFTVCIPING